MGYQGRLTSLGVGKETTYGTGVAATTTGSVVSSTLAEKSTFQDAEDLHHGSGGAACQRAELGRDVAGQIVIPVNYSGVIGLFLEGLLGQVVDAGAGPYTHTFTHNDPGSLLAYSFIFKDGSSGYRKVFVGCMMTKGTISWKARQYAKLTLDVVAQKMDSDSSAAVSAPTICNRVLPHHAGNVAWNSVSYAVFTSLDIEIDNHLELTPVIGSLYTQNPEPSSRLTVKVKWEARLTAAQRAVLDANRQAGTQSNLTFTFTGGAEVFAITVHNAQLTELDAPLTGQGPVMVTGTFEATNDGTGADGISIVITNANALYSS